MSAITGAQDGSIAPVIARSNHDNVCAQVYLCDACTVGVGRVKKFFSARANKALLFLIDEKAELQRRIA
jgi:hypothetical protein